MSSPDSFAERFDSIEIGRDSACSPAAFEQALAIAQPPGFTMIDDADGRFVVDPEFGFVSVASDEVLARDMGSVHAVALRVVEQSGESYRLDLQLRITGRVPQMVGAEDFGLAAPGAEQSAPIDAVAAPPQPQATLEWNRFAAALAQAGKAPLAQTRGAFIAAPLPACADGGAALSLCETAPAPFSAQAEWSL
ncbi:MAG: hypothetical protein JNJ63_11570 [Hyphomonadaceae bacterium]|nr:hypothetical protein [Hyphomonadaceae bacterium]